MAKGVLKLIPGSSQFPMVVHNFGVWGNRRFPAKKSSFFRALMLAVYHIGIYLSVITRKVQIEEFVNIGPGLWLSPKGRIIIGANSIGTNCVIHHNVTIGMNFAVKKSIGVPKIGDNVTLEANSLIYGDICLGDGVVVKEGTVVSKCIPAGCVVQGNPGRVVSNKR